MEQTLPKLFPAIPVPHIVSAPPECGREPGLVNPRGKKEFQDNQNWLSLAATVHMRTRLSHAMLLTFETVILRSIPAND